MARRWMRAQPRFASPHTTTERVARPSVRPGEPRIKRGEGKTCQEERAGCRVMSYLKPCFVFVVAVGVFLGPARAAVDGLSLAGRRILLRISNGRPLPVLHLDDGGGMSRHDGGGGSNRHERDDGRGKGGLKGGVARAERTATESPRRRKDRGIGEVAREADGKRRRRREGPGTRGGTAEQTGARSNAGDLDTAEKQRQRGRERRTISDSGALNQGPALVRTWEGCVARAIRGDWTAIVGV